MDMLPLRRCAFITVFVLTACGSADPAETLVVGVARRRVRLPCRVEAAGQGGVEVCWGRGEAPVFSCQNAVIHTAGNQLMFRRSYRFSVSSSSSSLSIFAARTSDSGLYHCRVQLPGLFNEQTASVRLLVTDRSTAGFGVSTTTEALRNLNAPHTRLQAGFTSESVASGNNTGPVVGRVQSSIKQQPANSLLGFIGNTLRTSCIIFIPALLLTAAYRCMRTNKRVKTDGGLKQTHEEESFV